jgi:hypothetical protein
MTGAMLGRERECAALDTLLQGVRTGHSRVLVVRGEAGIGKSALLDHLAARAADHQVQRTAGVESELELPYSGLHQLCAGMLDHLERVPGPQRDALLTALGHAAGEAPDRFLVGLAVLGLMADVAARRPLVCLIDDAQWLDHSSAQTLTFVARRLHAEAVALVFAVRDPSDALSRDGLPELQVSGLGDAHARALMDSVIPGPVDPRLRDRIARLEELIEHITRRGGVFESLGDVAGRWRRANPLAAWMEANPLRTGRDAIQALEATS